MVVVWPKTICVGLKWGVRGENIPSFSRWFWYLMLDLSSGTRLSNLKKKKKKKKYNLAALFLGGIKTSMFSICCFRPTVAEGVLRGASAPHPERCLAAGTPPPRGEGGCQPAIFSSPTPEAVCSRIGSSTPPGQRPEHIFPIQPSPGAASAEPASPNFPAPASPTFPRH